MKKTFYTDVLPAILLSLLLVGSISYFYLKTSKKYQASFETIQQVQARFDNLEEVYTQLLEMESSIRGYIVTDDSIFIANYRQTETNVLSKLNDNTTQPIDSSNRAVLDTLKNYVGQKLAIMATGIDKMQSGKRDSILSRSNKGKGRVTMLKIKDCIDQIKGKELAIVKANEVELQSATGQNFVAILVGLFLTLSLLSYWAWRLVGTNWQLYERNVSLASTQLKIAETNTQLSKTKQELEMVNNNLEQIIDDRTKALYESENRLRSLADFIPQLVWRCEPNGALEYVNKQWVEYSGLKLVDVAGDGWLKMLHPDDVERSYNAWKHSVTTGTMYEIEYRLRDKTGEYQWFLGRAFPSLDMQGNIVKWFGTCTNVEEQKNAHQALERKVAKRTAELTKINDELLRSNAELEQFAYVASHDLQEPLRKIHAFGERLEIKFRPVLGDEGIDFLNRMRSASTRMQVLIDDLLNFSRVSRVKNPFQKIDLNIIISEVLANMEESLTSTSTSIHMDVLPSVLGDQSQMMQMFQNLLSNALKFRKPDVVPQINISCKLATSEEVAGEFEVLSSSKFYLITVQDNGIGFEAKYAERIFTIFQRLHGRNEYPGTGIGLAICKKVAENHGGRIKAKANPGEGATFLILLPKE